MKIEFEKNSSKKNLERAPWGAMGRRGGRGAFPCMGCMESAVTWRGVAGRRGAPRRPTLVLPKTRVLNGELLVRCVM